MKKKRVLITAGGTGGHLYPALATAESLPQYECHFIAGGLKNNPFFDKDLFPFIDVDCGTLHPKNVMRIFRGIKESLEYFREFQPDLIVGFGSYHTFPVLAAAVVEKVPYILHESNIIPGKVNKWMSYFAKITGVFLPNASKCLIGKSLPVDMPLRKEYRKGVLTRAEALRHYGFDSSIPTVLIFGGSQGARTINLIMITLLENKQFKTPFQVIHLTGNGDSVERLQILYANNQIRACVKAFESRMDIAWQTCDLSITRAGAGSIAEQMEFEVPGILIPYPHASDNHQKENALYFQNQVKGGVMILENELTPMKLISALDSFFDNHLKRQKQMSEEIKKYKESHQRNNAFAILIEKMIEKGL